MRISLASAQHPMPCGRLASASPPKSGWLLRQCADIGEFILAPGYVR